MDAAARILPPELAATVQLGRVAEERRRLPLPAPLAELLGGGLPRGRVCEVTGARGSGRTSLIHTLLAATTAAAELTAVVDAADAFDPASAARAGTELAAVLWVRPPSAREALRCAETILGAGGFGLVVLDLDGVPLQRLRSYSWPRLARVAEKSGAALVLLAPHRLAGSFAMISVELEARRRLFSVTRAAPRPVPLFDGIESYGVVVHDKRGPRRAAPRLRWTLAAE